MDKKLTFERIDQRWFIKLANWQGLKDDLEMIGESAELLDNISSYANKPKTTEDLEISFEVYTTNEEIKQFNYAEPFYMKYQKRNVEMIGAEYELIKGSSIVEDVNCFWVCPVTEFVLGEYPKYVYIILGNINKHSL